MKPYKLFIQCNKKQLMGAYVAKYSFLKNASVPFEVEIMMAEDHPYMQSQEGQLHLREGKKVVWRNDLQSFTPLRFLPPHLMNYSGRAIVIDPDVFALKDCGELFEMDMQGKAIWARKVYDSKRGDYWASSVMLLDCAKLRHWLWPQNFNELFTFERDYRTWMSLGYEDPNTIGELAEEWNHYDVLNSNTRFLHNTSRITQPWKTGLPIDFTYSPSRIQGSQSVLSKIKKIFGINDIYKNLPNKGVFLPHPDKEQENLFYSLLSDCLKEGVVSEQLIQEEIQAGNIRRDSLDLIHRRA